MKTSIRSNRFDPKFRPTDWKPTAEKGLDSTILDQILLKWPLTRRRPRFKYGPHDVCRNRQIGPHDAISLRTAGCYEFPIANRFDKNDVDDSWDREYYLSWMDKPTFSLFGNRGKVIFRSLSMSDLDVVRNVDSRNIEKSKRFYFYFIVSYADNFFG